MKKGMSVRSDNLRQNENQEAKQLNESDANVSHESTIHPFYYQRHHSFKI